MIKEFREFIEQESLCSRDDSILVAVSGGLDSMVLLDLFHKTGNRLFIAHCNFKLRDIESDEDEATVGMSVPAGGAASAARGAIRPAPRGSTVGKYTSKHLHSC